MLSGKPRSILACEPLLFIHLQYLFIYCLSHFYSLYIDNYCDGSDTTVAVFSINV